MVPLKVTLRLKAQRHTATIIVAVTVETTVAASYLALIATIQRKRRLSMRLVISVAIMI
jgi:hypothetical protein